MPTDNEKNDETVEKNKPNLVESDVKDNSELGVSTSDSGIGVKRRTQPLDMPLSPGNNAGLPSWVAGASPAKSVSMDELMKMNVALENMALVHEIAINPDFEISEKPTNPIERAVSDCMHQAYWDKLKEDFAQDPPDYSHAVMLLEDIKKVILDLLTPQHVRLRSEIDCMLDIPLLKQQIDNECLDLEGLFKNIINLLSRLCAPARDEAINKLRQESDSASIMRPTIRNVMQHFSGICELLDVMKVDMANFYVKMSRAAIEGHSAEYERACFLKLLEAHQQETTATKAWLKRHLQCKGAEDNGPSSAKKRLEDLSNSQVESIISDAYMDLLEWDVQHDYPETLKIDFLRLEALAEKFLQLIVVTTCSLITFNCAGRDVAEMKDFKEKLKNEIVVITNDIEKGNITETVESVYTLCNDRVAQSCKELGREYPQSTADLLKEQIRDVINPENRVRKLIHDRIRSFILSMVSNQAPSSQVSLPHGLSLIQREIAALTARFLRIVNHNRQTFGTLYGELLQQVISESCGNDQAANV